MVFQTMPYASKCRLMISCITSVLISMNMASKNVKCRNALAAVINAVLPSACHR